MKNEREKSGKASPGKEYVCEITFGRKGKKRFWNYSIFPKTRFIARDFITLFDVSTK